MPTSFVRLFRPVLFAQRGKWMVAIYDVFAGSWQRWIVELKRHNPHSLFNVHNPIV
jgi:hypothetical protein